MEKTYNPTEGVMIKNTMVKTESNLFKLANIFLEKAVESNAKTKKLREENCNSLADANDRLTDVYIECAKLITDEACK